MPGPAAMQVDCYPPPVVESGGGSHSHGLCQLPALAMGPDGALAVRITAVVDSMHHERTE